MVNLVHDDWGVGFQPTLSINDFQSQSHGKAIGFLKRTVLASLLKLRLEITAPDTALNQMTGYVGLEQMLVIFQFNAAR